MNDPESRSLWRAALVLLLVSSLRWGLSRPSQSAPLPDADVLPELTASAGAATTEAEARARPLGADERIDPNRATETELDRLPGIGLGTALAIITARDSGAVFRRTEDLLQVRGIGPASLAKIAGALDLANPPPRRGPKAPTIYSTRSAAAAGISTGPIDVNRAGLTDLQRLPGVGPVLAGRIIETRRTRPFESLDDLVRVSGIGPRAVERLRLAAVAGRRRQAP